MMMATQHDVYLCKKQQQQKFIGLVFSLVCLFVLDKKTCHFCCCWWWYRIDSTFLWWFFILLFHWLTECLWNSNTHTHPLLIRFRPLNSLLFTIFEFWINNQNKTKKFVYKHHHKNFVFFLIYNSWISFCWFFLMDLCNVFVWICVCVWLKTVCFEIMINFLIETLEKIETKMKIVINEKWQ